MIHRDRHSPQFIGEDLQALSSCTPAKELGSPTGSGRHGRDVSGVRTPQDGTEEPMELKESNFRIERDLKSLSDLPKAHAVTLLKN